MLVDQQWEYCELSQDGVEVEGEKRFYDLSIFYFGPQGGFYTLSEKRGKNAKAWPYNPWGKAIGLLGLAGWELVNVQHGHTGGGYVSDGELRYNNKIAYFKRAIRPGRSIDEPKLVLE